MYILHVKIVNFRGIKQADWSLDGKCLCLVGPNDSAKTTLLDAVEFALSPSPYLNLSEVDFHNTRTDQAIDISVTVGGIPSESPLWRDDKFGMFKRGWSRERGLVDEPEDEQLEPALTIRLHVDSSYEPEWVVSTDRQPDGLSISTRHRGMLGVVRLGTDVERDLAWGRYSVLSSLTEGNDAAEAVIAEAQRQLRKAANGNEIEKLNEAARRVEEAARHLGVRPADKYHPGLDPKLVTIRQGAFALHDGDIPVRAAGLGTRRLVALAVQRAAVPDGAIVLIDEVEHGLEPHRLRRLLRNLRQGLGDDTAGPRLGQVVMTTHSAVPLLELEHDELRVVRLSSGIVEALRPSEGVEGVLRRFPSAFLARKVLVCEGATEVGLCRRLAEYWMDGHQGVPVEHFGVEIADGGGSNAIEAAVALAQLKYNVAYLGDSDRASRSHIERMKCAGVNVNLWEDSLCTEQRIAMDLPEDGLGELLAKACKRCGQDSVRNVLSGELKLKKVMSGNPSQLEAWTESDIDSDIDIDIAGFRRAFGVGAKGSDKRKGWFKSIEGGRDLGEIVVKHLRAMTESPLSTTLKTLENWCYDGGSG